MGDWQAKYGLQAATAAEITAQLAPLPDAQEARQALERFLDAVGARGGMGIAGAMDARGAMGIGAGAAPPTAPASDAPAARGLARLAYAAPFLLRHLARRPAPVVGGLLGGLETPAALLPWRDYLPPESFPSLGESELMRAFRLWKYDNYTRITAQDLLGLHPTARTCELLSDLAEEMLSLAYRHAFVNLAARHGLPVRSEGGAALGAIMGMGKLGGRELNYASDVDVIFFHDGGDAPCRPVAGPGHEALAAAVAAEDWAALHPMVERAGVPSGRLLSGGEFHNRLARQVIRLLSTNTAEGFGFRVDVDLRPQGRSGLLAPSLSFLSQYYEVHGREWERTALLKARRVGGAPEVFQRLEEIVRPFVFRRYLDYSAVEGIAIVKHDIDRNHRAGREHDLKLGEGGIRENEFFVQALQLLYGGKQPQLQVASHQEALRRLVAAGVLDGAEGDEHLADYWLLRTLENRLQMVAEAQTHTLPPEGPARSRLFVDFQNPPPERQGGGGAPAVPPGLREGEAEERLAEARRRTAARFHGLFAQMGPEGFPEAEAWQEAVKRHLPEAEREEALARVDGLLNRLMRTRIGERCVFKIGWLLTRPELYRSGTRAALPRWLDFLEQIGNRNAILTLVEAHPRLIEWSSAIFAEGGLHAEQLIRHPEFLESFVGGAAGADAPWEPFPDILENARDEEEFILELQRAKSQALIRILGLYLDAPEGNEHRELLSGLAQATVETCARYAWRLLAARDGAPESGEAALSGFAVLALGKLGSREMRFGSDLDLAFVYDREGTTGGGKSHYEFYTRLAQRVGSLLTVPTQFGKLYEIDHRLRPFGTKGVLVPTRAAYEGFAGEAEVWNFQAFTRIRPLCGDEPLARRVIDSIVAGWQGRNAASSQVAREVREMLGRLVSEHAPSPRAAEPRLPLKYTVGGMIGCEFLRQCHFLIERRKPGAPWEPPPETEAIRALGPAYDTISALDERLSLHDPRFEHEVAPSHFQQLAAIGERWNFEEVRALTAETESRVEAAFTGFEQGG